MAVSFVLKYDGLDADEHALDVRCLGQAMIALDKIVNAGLIALIDYRKPRRRERLGLRIRAKEPAQGSFEILAELSPVIMASVLPLLPNIVSSAAGDIIWRWISWVLNMAGGRQSEAEPHFSALMELTRELHKGRFDNEEALRKFFLDILDQLQPAARGLVAPVGPSANTLTVTTASSAQASSESTTIDFPMAEAIRNEDQLTVGEAQKMIIRVDGLIHHSKQLKIEHPSQPEKYITAEVRDPSFTDGENLYTNAVRSRGLLEVLAKPTFRPDGTIHTLYILDAKLTSG